MQHFNWTEWREEDTETTDSFVDMGIKYFLVKWFLKRKEKKTWL